MFARTATLVNDIETEDVAALASSTPSGALSTLSATLGSTPEVSRLRFSFARLTAESNHEPYEFPGDPWVFTGDTEDDQAADRPGPRRLRARSRGLGGPVRRASPTPSTEASRRRSPSTTPGTGCEVATACYRSARTGADVALPIAPDDPDYEGWQP